MRIHGADFELSYSSHGFDPPFSLAPRYNRNTEVLNHCLRLGQGARDGKGLKYYQGWLNERIDTTDPASTNPQQRKSCRSSTSACWQRTIHAAYSKVLASVTHGWRRKHTFSFGPIMCPRPFVASFASASSDEPFRAALQSFLWSRSLLLKVPDPPLLENPLGLQPPTLEGALCRSVQNGRSKPRRNRSFCLHREDTG